MQRRVVVRWSAIAICHVLALAAIFAILAVLGLGGRVSFVSVASITVGASFGLAAAHALRMLPVDAFWRIKLSWIVWGALLFLGAAADFEWLIYAALGAGVTCGVETARLE